MVTIIDTHTHLDAPEFAADREEVIARAFEAGVRPLITIGSGYGLESIRKAVEIAEAHEDIFAAVGVHPQQAGEPLNIAAVEAYASHPKVVAIGETGLDYYWKTVPPAPQHEWLRAQIRLALEVKKPLIIHCREAADDCLKILLEENASKVGGVFHCFAEDGAFSQKVGELNFLISVPGNITFKKADKFREAVLATPLSRIMIETDAPFLAPVPYRGKRCESSMAMETARYVAELKGISLEELAAVTSENAKRLFKLP